MPRSASGVYAPTPSNVAPAVSNTTIDPVAFNALVADFTAEMTNSWDRGGRGAATAIMDMGGFQLKNVGAPTMTGDAVTLDYFRTQVQTGALVLGTVGGTADAITATFSPNITALVNGMMVGVRLSAANATTTPTFAAGTTAAKTIKKGANAALAIGDMPGAAFWALFRYDGTTDKWVLQNPWIINPVGMPQGRLTASSGVPVMTSSIAAATSVYYTPYLGNQVPVFDLTGTSVAQKIFSELSQALSDTTKSPAAAVANKNYDLFVWDDAGTLRCTRGPAWTNNTTRASSLTRSAGLLVNASSIANGPDAGAGLYVGTIRTNGSATLDYIFGASGSGGTAGFFGVWNMYHRRAVSTMVQDSTAQWDYLTATIRQADASSGNQVSFVHGLAEDSVSAYYMATAYDGSGAHIVGVGLDSTTSFTGVEATISIGGSTPITLAASLVANNLLGFHYIAALEKGGGGASTRWFGAGQQGLTVNLEN